MINYEYIQMKNEIERKRKEMAEYVKQYGILSDAAIQKSQELDIYILKIQQLQMKNEHGKHSFPKEIWK